MGCLDRIKSLEFVFTLPIVSPWCFIYESFTATSKAMMMIIIIIMMMMVMVMMRFFMMHIHFTQTWIDVTTLKDTFCVDLQHSSSCPKAKSSKPKSITFFSMYGNKYNLCPDHLLNGKLWCREWFLWSWSLANNANLGSLLYNWWQSFIGVSPLRQIRGT